MSHEPRQGGQSLVEFVIAIPLLLLIAFGALDLARLFQTQIIISNAARESVRYLTLNPDDLDDSFSGTIAAAQREAQNSGIALSAGDVAISCTTDSSGTIPRCKSGYPARVTVSSDFHLSLELFFPSPIPMSNFAEMMVQ